MDEKGATQRRACRVLGQARSTQRRTARGRWRHDQRVEERLLSLANAHPTWGCPQLHDQLRADGHVINHKRTARLYATHGLSLRRRRRRRAPEREPQPLVQPIRPNQCWSMDFMSDALLNGRTFRTLNVIDDFARDALVIAIDFSLASGRVIRELERLCEIHGQPERIRSDNGPEFTAHAVQNWAKERGITWEFIRPGCPAQNAYVERFNGTYRLEVLDAYRFVSLTDARSVTQAWLDVYNEKRIHSAIGHLPPKAFKQRWQEQQKSLHSAGTA